MEPFSSYSFFLPSSLPPFLPTINSFGCTFFGKFSLNSILELLNSIDFNGRLQHCYNIIRMLTSQNDTSLVRSYSWEGRNRPGTPIQTIEKGTVNTDTHRLSSSFPLSFPFLYIPSSFPLHSLPLYHSLPSPSFTSCNRLRPSPPPPPIPWSHSGRQTCLESSWHDPLSLCSLQTKVCKGSKQPEVSTVTVF